MQQQPPPTMNPAPQIPPNAMTTEQIQKCLDDNKNLILAILENQNLGKLNECAQYQALLQKNLMYLAAIADAQPQPPQPPNPSQMPPNSVPPQATQYMQQPQPATPQQQQGGIAQKLPFQLNALRPDQQQHLLQFQQQQQMQAQMGMRPGVQNAMLGMHQSMQAGLGTPGSLMDARVGKQDGQEAASGGDGQGKSASGRGSGNRDS